MFGHRFAAIQACEQQLLQFRGLSGSLLRWLETAQDQLPPKEANLNIEALQRRVRQLKVFILEFIHSKGTINIPEKPSCIVCGSEMNNI